MPIQTIPDFSTVTEVPMDGATAEQFQIMYTRYDLAARHASDKDVLEVACGTGVGLGLLARVARRTVAGDIDERNLAVARETYSLSSNVELKQFDAQEMPFSSASFDVVLLFEALYYIPSPDSFFCEARRVLRPGGMLLISTVNSRWSEFNPSPFSITYFDALALSQSLALHGFDVELYGGFPVSNGGLASSVIRGLRKSAVRLHLIPKTMRNKKWLKRLFYGKLKPIPRSLDSGAFTPAPLVSLAPPYDVRQYRFIYAVAKTKSASQCAPELPDLNSLSRPTPNRDGATPFGQRSLEGPSSSPSQDRRHE